MSCVTTGIDLLSLDAGNTVIFLDHQRVARILDKLGFPVEPSALIRGEGVAKRWHVYGHPLTVSWSHDAAPGARAWGTMVGTMINQAGVSKDSVPGALDALWGEHIALNLWSLVPDVLPHALQRLRARGKKAVIVSNSEGMLESLFERLGILHCFDRVVDSGTLGIEKPDPRIFWRAYEGFGVDVQSVLHLGDSISTDIEGARAARVHSALLDPFEHWRGAYEDVPRVASVAAVVDEILSHCD